MNRLFALVACVLLFACFSAHAEDKDDWIRGKLFPPDVILKHQQKLKLTDKQRDAIGAELKRVQAQAAESDWQIMSEASDLQQLVDQHPVNTKAVLERVDRVFVAENRKKRLFVEMLVNIKNLLTPEQVDYLRSVTAPQQSQSPP